MIRAVEVLGTVGRHALPVYSGMRSVRFGYTRDAIKLGVAALLQKIFLECVVKEYIPKARPYPFDNHLDSFASGHTASAFLSLGHVVAMECSGKIKRSKTCIITLTAFSALVGLTRYLANKHYPEDVFIGAAIGFSVGFFSIYLTRQKAKYL